MLLIVSTVKLVVIAMLSVQISGIIFSYSLYGCALRHSRCVHCTGTAMGTLQCGSYNICTVHPYQCTTTYLLVLLYTAVLVPTDPQALTSLVGRASSATSIRISWLYSASPSSLTNSGGYLIQYRAVSPQGISDAGDVKVRWYTSSYTIQGLEEGVQYLVMVNAYVRSRNGVATSAYVTTRTRGTFIS